MDVRQDLESSGARLVGRDSTGAPGGRQSAAGPGSARLLKGSLVDGLSFEASPAQLIKKPDILSRFASGTEIYIPVLPKSALEERLDAVRLLHDAGMRPVPHVAARALGRRDELRDTLERLAEAGADALLLIAGDVDSPKGPYADTMSVLETGLIEAAGFKRLTVAGHPEGHPNADDKVTDEALLFKQSWADSTGTDMWVTTQFVFDLEKSLAWERRLQDKGVFLPVRLGLAGPAKLATVVAYALRCGVSASARMLSKRPDVTKLFARWSPDPLVDGLSERPETGLITRLHLFPFGGLAALADWRDQNRETTP